MAAPETHPPILPKLRNDIVFTPVVEAGEPYYIIEDPIQHDYYRIGKDEYLLAANLNRFTDLHALLSFTAAHTDTPLDQEQALTVLNWLAARQLLQQSGAQALSEHLAHEKKQEQVKQWSRLNLITIKLPLFNPDPLLSRLPQLTWLTGKGFALLWLMLGGYAGWLLLTNWQRFTGQAEGFFGVGNLVWIWLIWFGLKIVHELFHALVCYRYGGRVYEAGMLLILFIPLTYVNATSSWKFPSKWQRMHVAVAGMFIELGVAFGAIILWAYNPGTTTGFIAHNTALIASISSLLFNANPLMRFDGYYVLSDLLSIPNLYQQGLLCVKSRMTKWFLGIGEPTAATPFIKFYGAAIYVWRILVLVSLGYLATKLAGGLGIFITLGALIAWVGMPLFFFIQRLPQYKEQNPRALSHLLLRVALCIMVGTTLTYLIGWEKRIQAPAIVEYKQQYSVKTTAPGFVTNIHVTDGQQVKADDLLVSLENKELEQQFTQLTLLSRQLELKMRLANSRGYIGELQSLKEEHQSILAELEVLQSDITSLELRAPGNGTIISSNLQDSVGTFIPRGKELLWIVAANQKQLTGQSSQDDIESFGSQVGKKLFIEMRSGGLGTFEATLESVEPTGKTDLVHPALGAVYGGPLDVRQYARNRSDNKLDYEYSYRLFTPHFTLNIDLPPKVQQHVFAGQTATVLLRGNRETLADMLVSWFTKWRKKKDGIL